ncbi:MAG: hypothetical protein BWX80_02180 [Candidatus Hydrogenedentes bacterium ADurb.Bin101]|nr:MAG: hypothetical protein BWX80_02180 [Candidatus Hydrogenedentes bacterium ADurb.Bin101]
MPSSSNTPMAAALQMIPFIPKPASVRPRWIGCRVWRDNSRFTKIRSAGRLLLQESTIRSSRTPSARACSVDCSADCTMHRLMILSAASGTWLMVFSSSIFFTNSGSSDPALTPMRRALSPSRARAQISAKCAAWASPLPTFPGLMRYLSRASAHGGYSRRRVCPL